MINSPQVTDRRSQLHQITSDVGSIIRNTRNIELQPQSIIAHLKKLPSSTSALDTLKGLLSTPLLTLTLGIDNDEVMERCFINAGLVYVQDLLELCKGTMGTNQNIVKLVNDHLEKSRAEACGKMNSKDEQAFNNYWNRTIPRDFIDHGKIVPRNSRYCTRKMDEWDFLKLISFEEELKNLSREEHILTETRLFRGDKGDFFLKINNIWNSTNSGKIMLGGNNFAKLQEDDNYLWSPDGKSFYLLSIGERVSIMNGCRPSSRTYKVSIETEEGNRDARVEMRDNDVYATLTDENNRPLATQNYNPL